MLPRTLISLLILGCVLVLPIVPELATVAAVDPISTPSK